MAEFLENWTIQTEYKITVIELQELYEPAAIDYDELSAQFRVVEMEGEQTYCNAVWPSLNGVSNNPS